LQFVGARRRRRVLTHIWTNVGWPMTPGIASEFHHSLSIQPKLECVEVFRFDRWYVLAPLRYYVVLFPS